jgi:hypothetical protein
MSNDLAALLAAEAEHAEANPDAPEQPRTKATRPGGARAHVLSVRLSDTEAAALDAAAARARITPSALIRAWIAERLDDGTTTDPHALARTLQSVASRLEALKAS